jgi:hypothetical protein
MDDLRPSIGILSTIGEGNTEVFCSRMISLKDRTRVEHGDTRTEIPSDPDDAPIFFYDGSFRIEIIGVDGPVFD